MARSAMLWAPLALLAALAHLVSADIEFSSFKAGDTLKGGQSVVIEWKDSGDSPSISDLTTYELWICAGGNDEGTIIPLLAITTTPTLFTTTGNKATAVIGTGIGASKPANAYFFKIQSTAAKGGTIINYSDRFSLSGMAGTFPQAVIDGMKDVDGTDGPAKVDSTSDGTDPAAAPAAGDSAYEVAYTMQTGPTRYAPMQPVPPTKITQKNTSPQHPTSGFTVATTFMGKPNIETTITQSQTFSVTSRENPASPAPMPSDDMQKFLNRWKD